MELSQSQKVILDVDCKISSIILYMEDLLDVIYLFEGHLKRAEVSLCEMHYPIEELGARECIDKAKSCETIAERIILLETELKMKEKQNYYL